MQDPRYEKLADILVNYSTKVKKGETVVISSGFDGLPLVKEIALSLIHISEPTRPY